VSPVGYELDFYIPEYGVVRSHHRENLRSSTNLFVIKWLLWRGMKRLMGLKGYPSQQDYVAALVTQAA
jgi:hypothetical protein